MAKETRMIWDTSQKWKTYPGKSRRRFGLTESRIYSTQTTDVFAHHHMSQNGCSQKIKWQW